MQTRTEQLVASLLAGVLKRPLDSLPADTLFVDLGLDSLGGIRLLGELEDTLDTTLDPMIVLDHPSIQALAAYLDGLSEGRR